MYKVWIQTNANPYIIWQWLELGGYLFLKIFQQTRRRGGHTFAALQQASKGGGKVDNGECSGDPLPGILDAVLVQALAAQPL
jgi:hypothetical protein